MRNHAKPTAAKQESAGRHSELASTVGSSADADVQLGAEAQVRKEEEELRLEKNMRVSPALLPLVLADKVGELDNHLEALVCHFVKLGRCKLPWNKV